MNRTAVITGGAGGLGRAMAARLQAQGWHTVLIDLPAALPRDRDGPLQSSIGCDLTDERALRETCERISADRRTIDLVIYNAGVTQVTSFEAASMAAHRKLFEINYFAAVACAQAFLHPLRKSGGTHLAISSVAGFSPLVQRTAYGASKHALEGFFKSLRSEERKHGVNVAIAAPSFVATNTGNPQAAVDGLARPGSASDGIDYMSAEDAAKCILNGMEKGRDFIPVGRVARMAHALNRLSPRLFQALMERKINRKDQGG